MVRIYFILSFPIMTLAVLSSLPSPPLLSGATGGAFPFPLAAQAKLSTQRLASAPTASRQLGPTEAAYVLPSRENGVNDMYLHLGLTAPSHLLAWSRVSLVWAILRLRHPLLAARVNIMDYDVIRFEHSFPKSPLDAVSEARANIQYKPLDKDALIDGYLNGPRTLSNDKLACLLLSSTSSDTMVQSPPATPVSNSSMNTENADLRQHDILICTTHFVGDGMALHQTANDFFALLGSSHDQQALWAMVEQEWRAQRSKESILPTPLEHRLPLPEKPSKFRDAVARVDYENLQKKQIGGQVFPKRHGKTRHTVVPTVAIDEARTKRILKTCKANGVSISAAMFALCNVAWTRASGNSGELPTLLYSVMNLRSNLRAEKALHDSYWFIAVTYFNVILPTFLPADGENLVKTFWHRSRSSKQQMGAAARSPMLIQRTQFMADERAARSRVFAKEDDEKARGIWTPPPSPKPKKADVPAPAPSAALMGLSMLGNLDGIYHHETFGEVKLNTLTTGSRQRSGAILLFAYTFVGKLWISLGYDENGLEPERVQTFWAQLLAGVDEFLDLQ
ncbi:hypothetical protein CYLTODRAFT_216536 [Cylindrobasidium torrendii FP15055 ss-10]|uniref:CoA-dependent acyltransferase n=1 Tax=Cylindrobasidium torrendii FP15055 ss-10 TaxID=1314674 RepID=A0A0D7BST1_9AGAR|nr:hypothetical protein CYLTODRAFT_216536 [Cylindrobasidium torrendii FP15055 ss-10]